MWALQLAILVLLGIILFSYRSSGAMAKKIVIAVMGPTGSGKSSFIQNLTQDKTIKVGHGLESSQSQSPQKSRSAS